MSSHSAPGLARRLAANTLHAASGRVLSIVAWLLLTPAILRALGPEGYGVWSLFFALTGYLTALDVGFAQATLRYVASSRATRTPGGGGEYATLAILGYGTLGAMWIVVTPLLREPAIQFLHVPPALHATAAFAFTAGAIVFMLVGFANTTVSVLQGFDRFDLGNLVTLTVSLVNVAGILVALRLHAGLSGMVVATGVGWLSAALVGVVALRAGVRDFRWSSPARAVVHLREMLRFGGPMQVSNVLGVVHQQLDKILLARLVRFALVAPFELGLRVASAASTFSQLLLLAMIPAASAMHAGGDYARLQMLHRRASRFVLTVAAVLSAAMLGGANALFAAWIGHADAAAALALRGLAVATYFAVAAGVTTTITRGVGRTDLEAELSGVALVVHLGLGIALAPRYGLAGTLVALVVANLVSMAWFRARLAGVLGWNRLGLVLEPLGAPALATVLGGLAGAWAERSGHLPAWPWGRAVLIAAVSGAVAAALSMGTGYLKLAELRELVRARRSA